MVFDLFNIWNFARNLSLVPGILIEIYTRQMFSTSGRESSHCGTVQFVIIEYFAQECRNLAFIDI